MQNLSRRKIIYVTASLGLLTSLYLSYIKLSGNTIKCVFGSACKIVQGSKYAEILGIPVAFLGIIFYLVLFGLNFYAKKALLKLWILFGLVFTAYLTFIELFVIHALCPGCVISGILILFSAISLKKAN